MRPGGDHDLSGRWSGLYNYPDGGPPTIFEADLRESAGLLTGTTTELADSGDLYGQTIGAVIDGRRVGSSVAFLKMYDGASPDHDVVRYEGALDPDGNEIEGIWIIPEIWSGTFLMMRARAEQVEKEAEIEEKVPFGR